MTVRTGSKSKTGYSAAKIIFSIIALAILIGAIGASVYAVRRRNQLRSILAWDCSNFNFYLSEDGNVSVSNDSPFYGHPQQAIVYINSEEIITLDVPALMPGKSSQLGKVTTPSTGEFTWEIVGTRDCRDSGHYQP